MTNKLKLLFAAVAGLGLALGYYANGTMVGSMMAERTIAMACMSLEAAGQAGQLTKAQGDEIFAVLLKTLDKGRTASTAPGHELRCSSSM